MYRKVRDAVQRAGAREHHRVRQDTSIYARGTRRRRRRHRAALLLGVSRHESRGAQGVPGDPPRRHAEERASAACRRATTSTSFSTITPTNRSSTRCSAEEEGEKENEMSTPADAPKPKKSVALSGVTAGNTALCTVGRSGNDLHYRGYDILEVAETCEFEEIAYLLIHGKLPNTPELAAYKAKLKNLRGMPAPVRAVLEQLPPPRIPWTSCAPARRRWAACCPRSRRPRRRGRARDRRSPAGELRLDALLLVSLLAQQPPHPRRDRRRLRGRAFPAPAASASRRRRAGCAPCTPRSISTPSTSSTPPRSPRA